jgi:hypothetical protein
MQVPVGSNPTPSAGQRVFLGFGPHRSQGPDTERQPTAPGDPDIASPLQAADLASGPVEVRFRKMGEQRLTTWEALRGKRTRVPGTTMALGKGGMPHDLTQMVVEGALGIERGFWGSIANGATFRSTGRKRTRPGRAVISANRDHLATAEALVAEHLARWERGDPTPAGRLLQDIERHWSDLGDGDELLVEWPSLRVPSATSSRHPPSSRGGHARVEDNRGEEDSRVSPRRHRFHDAREAL